MAPKGLNYIFDDIRIKNKETQEQAKAVFNSWAVRAGLSTFALARVVL